MLSNGGLTHVGEAKRAPVQMLESGPAAGALVGAFFGARRGECRHVLAFDMGGTTAKLSVVDDGEPLVAYSFEAAREQRFIEGSGLPIRISTVELIEIGAGGGSIAHVDELGLLKVGPESAGAQPGPACYGRGGERPTVTDADLVLGYLNRGLLRRRHHADQHGGGDGRARSVWRVRSGSMRSQTRVGHPRRRQREHGERRARAHRRARPRSAPLRAAGDRRRRAGARAATSRASSASPRVICPPSAGVASALGLLVAPARVDRVRTITAFAATDLAQLETHFRELEDEALRVIAETGIGPQTAVVTRLADMRYVGQGFELVVKLPNGPYGARAGPSIEAAFELDYRKVYSRTPPGGAAELINIRVSVEAPAGSGQLQFLPAGFAKEAVEKGSRPAYFGAGGFVATTVYDRKRLGVGASITGPALIEEPESTLLLPPGCTATVQANGNIIVAVR